MLLPGFPPGNGQEWDVAFDELALNAMVCPTHAGLGFAEESFPEGVEARAARGDDADPGDCDAPALHQSLDLISS